MRARLQNFLSRLKQENLDGFIVSSPANISYLCGFTSCDAYLLVSQKEAVYFTDSRYAEEVRPKLKGLATLKKINGSVFEIIAAACRQLRLERIGFEGRHMPYAEYRRIKGYLRPGEYLVPSHNLIESLRQIKDRGEVEKIRAALKITGSALQFVKSCIRPGIKELEIAAELERFIRYEGAISAAFDIIVASGPNSAHPHHCPTSKKILAGEPVLIDIGVNYFGYKSDLTRVFFSDKINSLARRIYDIILKAQGKAIAKIRPGEEISRIDALARNYIADKGYAKFFGHSLGHGIGLETHEAPPIAAKFEGILLPGMVFTVEPAVYLPGRFGIRIEDMVLVTKKGCEVLSGFIHK
jgi:Xaa-Pro aminopeptidase